jgi:hypothetical protein
VCVILETLPLTHWELGLKNCARTKQGIFYNLSDSLRGYSNLSSERYVYLKEKGSVVLSYQFLVLYLSSTQKTYNMENTIDLRKTGAENIIGKFSKKHSSQYIP